MAFIALIGATSSTRARTTIVPDDFPTIQAAVDFLYSPEAPDTLLVRGGDYPEFVLFSRGIRVEAIPSLDGSDDVPRIQGMRTTSDGGEHFLLIGLHFTGHVQHGGSNGPARIDFVRCRFDGGMTPGGISGGDLATVQLTHCTLFQSVLISADEGVMDFCTVYGPVVMTTPYRAYVADNIFENAGRAFFTRTRNAVVARNRVRGGEQAFVLEPDDDLDVHVVDNDIEGCRGYAIHVNSRDGPVRLERNRIARCGGFGAQVTGSIIARGNRVTDCRGPGLTLIQVTDTGIAEENVVGRCGVAGIQLTYAFPQEPPPNFSVRGNTVYGCSGPGIAISDLPGSTITRNIVYACLGLSASDSDPLDVSCNDWFQVLGTPASPSDFSVDPQFCDLAADDLHLRSDSPLLDMPGCGRIGALGQGCEAPVLAIGFEMWPRVLEPTKRARWVSAFLEPPLPFSVGDIEVSSVTVNGIPVALGAEAIIGDQDRDRIPDLQLRFDRAALERTLTAGDESTVTLSGRIARRPFSGTDRIRLQRYNHGPRPDVPRPATRERVLSIQVSPGVADGSRIEFTLAEESPARLEVMDLAGRIVLSREVGANELGLDLGAGQRLGQGVYFLRLRQGTSVARARIAVVR